MPAGRSRSGVLRARGRARACGSCSPSPATARAAGSADGDRRGRALRQRGAHRRSASGAGARAAAHGAAVRPPATSCAGTLLDGAEFAPLRTGCRRCRRRSARWPRRCATTTATLDALDVARGRDDVAGRPARPRPAAAHPPAAARRCRARAAHASSRRRGCSASSPSRPDDRRRRRHGGRGGRAAAEALRPLRARGPLRAVRGVLGGGRAEPRTAGRRSVGSTRHGARRRAPRTLLVTLTGHRPPRRHRRP